MTWQTELGSCVIQSLTEELGISGHGQGGEAGLFHSAPNVVVDFWDFGKIDLENLRGVWSILSEFLVGGSGP